MPVLDPKALIDNRVAAIRDMHAKARQPRAELDLSGGVDSAVMLGLLAKALGPENVTTAHLAINSNPDALARARECAVAFGVRLIEFDGTFLFDSLITTMSGAMVKAGYTLDDITGRCERDSTILGSIRSTLRAPWGRAANRLSGGGIRHGTGNEDEDRILRFYQKGGDGEVDSNPIAILSKGEVYQLAIALGVPRSIVEARPSPDLWGVGDQHNDEDEIGAYLGLKGCGLPFYSYVDPSTGEYRNVGLIERLSRFCDVPRPTGCHLFDDYHEFDAWGGASMLPKVLDLTADEAVTSAEFKDVPADVVRTLLTNARKVEAATRHKLNPNCPTLGSRAGLVDAGILTDKLPV
jgi:NAD+ synthetase